MSWRNQGITGSNNIPLGTRRRFGGSESATPDAYTAPEPVPYENGGKRGRSPVQGTSACPVIHAGSAHSIQS